MNTLKTNITLFLVLIAVNFLSGQTCYDDSYNHSGITASTDSVEFYSCLLNNELPEAVTSDFKVFSVANYGLSKNMDDTERLRVKNNTIQSIQNAHPYSLIFWWDHNDENQFNSCSVSFSFPHDNEYNNCFTSPRIVLVEANLNTFAENAITASITTAAQNHKKIEKNTIKALVKEILKVKNCCGAQKSDECSLCLSEDEVSTFKRRLKINRLWTINPVTGDYTLPPIPTAKSNSGDFISFVGDNLYFTTSTISIFDEFDTFSAAQSSNCSHTLFFTEESNLCDLDMSNANENVTLINVKTVEDGFILEVGQKIQADCESFLYYLIDKYPSEFGYRMNFIEDNELTPLERSEVSNLPVYCFYSPSGALIRNKNPNSTNTYSLKEVRLASPINSLAPLNTLTSFVYNDTLYRHYKRKKSDYAIGFYPSDHIEQLRREGVVVTTAYAQAVYSFTQNHSWAITPNGVEHPVIGFKYDGCRQGRSKCIWPDIAENTNIAGSFTEVIIPSTADCQLPTTPPEEVCCNLGTQYIRDQLSNATIQEERTALIRIGEIICEIGQQHFGDYEESPWGDLPDALQIFYEVSIQNVGSYECPECTYEDLIPVFEAYKDRLFNTSRDPVEITSWKNMAIFLRQFKNADVAVIKAEQRIHAIKVLAQHMDRDVWATREHQSPENNERLIVRLIKYQNTDKCQFIQLLLNDEELLRQLMYGFNDLSFFSGNGDEYFQFVENLMNHISDCPNVFDPRNYTYDKAFHIGYQIVDSTRNLRCEINIEGDCFANIKLSNPELTVSQGINGLMYSCGYNTTNTEVISLNGPLDYVPVFVESSLYGGLLDRGEYIIPSFLLCYLRDASINLDNRTALQALIAVAVISINIATITTGGIAALIAGIDIIGTVATTAINIEIADGSLREKFGPEGAQEDQEYQEYVDNYKKLENIFNSAMITQGIVELTGVVCRSLLRSVKNGEILHGTVLSNTATHLRAVRLLDKFRPSRFINYPRITTFVNQLDEANKIRLADEIGILSENKIQLLENDLRGMSSELRSTLAIKEESVRAYRLLSDLPNDWRLDVEILERLRSDILTDSGLKEFLEARGPNGTLAWKYADDADPDRPWCFVN